MFSRYSFAPATTARRRCPRRRGRSAGSRRRCRAGRGTGRRTRCRDRGSHRAPAGAPNSALDGVRGRPAVPPGAATRQASRDRSAIARRTRNQRASRPCAAGEFGSASRIAGRDVGQRDRHLRDGKQRTGVGRDQIDVVHDRNREHAPAQRRALVMGQVRRRGQRSRLPIAGSRRARSGAPTAG